MERIDNYHTQEYIPADVLISAREPYSKNTLWVYINNNIIEVRVFQKGWKTIFTSKDLGLSELATKQVNDILDLFTNKIQNSVEKLISKYNKDSIVLKNKQDNLEKRVKALEDGEIIPK